MTQTIYKPIYATWIVVYVTLVVGILVWILGGLLDLPWIWDKYYREFPSGLLLVFVITALAAASVFVGSFTGRAYLGGLAAAFGTLIAIIALWVIGWIMDTWDTTSMLVVVMMLAVIAVGLAVFMFARFIAAVVAWLVLSALVCVAILVWLEDKWGTSFLYYLLVVVAVALYAVVLAVFALVPKRFVEG